MAELYTVLLDRYLEDPAQLEADIAEDVGIKDVSGYADAFRHSAVYIKWASLKALCDTRFRRQKRYVEKELYAYYSSYYREWLREAKLKDTKDAVEEKVQQDPTYKLEMAKVRDLAQVTDLLKEVINALWQKKDMLSIIVGRYKAEERAQLPINSEANKMTNEMKDRFGVSSSKLTLEEIEELAVKNIIASVSK